MTAAIPRRTALGGLAALLIPLQARAEDAKPAADAGPLVLEAAPARAVLVPGAEPADIWSLNGEPGGPVIRIRHGQEFRALLRNATSAPLSLHWQGVRGPSASDGVGGLTQASVAPGASFEYRFTPPDAGLSLIRPMVLGGSSEPAGRGMGGLLIVEEREPPPVDADYALLVRDWLLEPSGALSSARGPSEAAASGRLGNRFMVGGQDAPKREELAPGSRVRLRLANGCNARLMRIRFDGLKVRVGAVDGQPTESFEPLGAMLPFTPGARYELFLDLPAEAGRTASITALVGPGLPLLEFTTSPARPAATTPPAILPPNRLLPVDIPLQNARRFDLTLSGGAVRDGSGQASYGGDPKRIWQVNGASGSPGSPPLFSVRRGQPVVLTLRNSTAFIQSLHLHGHVFRVLHALEDGWEPWWFDTAPIPDGKTVRIAFVADNPGRWLIGSTVLERLDTGLWTWFEVT